MITDVPTLRNRWRLATSTARSFQIPGADGSPLGGTVVSAGARRPVVLVWRTVRSLATQLA